jgi:uncharacterized repeat protein (TIGR01451 family)
MISLMKIGASAALFASALPATAQPVELVTRVMVEMREPARDGTTRIVLAPAARVTPGNRVVYQISYRNTGREAARDLVIANPVPAGLIYAGPAQGSPEPELSVDGARFGTLSQLSVRTVTGTRAATSADVRVVRWRLVKPVAAGGSGQVSFRAILK